MSSPPTSSVRIELVSDPSELPALASIFDIAVKASGDKFHDVMMHYVEDPYEETLKRLQAAQSAAVDDSPAERHFVFKAIETDPKHSPGDSHEHGRGNPGEVLQEKTMEENIVGMAHWTIGYINISKVDPLEQQAAPLEEPIPTSDGTAIASKPEPEPFDFYAVCRKPVRNTYISRIRGKKHVYLRRIAVHPDYQRRGIARQLLQWGLDRADSEKLVGYLNGRPQARRLYANGGFKAVDIVPMPVPGLEVSDMIVMVRQPQPVSG